MKSEFAIWREEIERTERKKPWLVFSRPKVGGSGEAIAAQVEGEGSRDENRRDPLRDE
jgi:hypothetical protein